MTVVPEEPHPVDQYEQLVHCVEMACPNFDQACIDWAISEPCRPFAEACIGTVSCETHADCGGPPCVNGTCEPGQCGAPCDSGQPGPCAAGAWSCDTLASCQPRVLPGPEACDDAYDNDCDGELDELECQYGLGVSCADPQLIPPGATLITTFAGYGPSTPTECGPSDADRVFRFTVPPGGADLVLDASRSFGVTYRLVSGDCQTGPGSCVGLDHGNPIHTEYLAGGDYHLIAAHTPYSGTVASARIDLRLALSVGGACLVSDVDGDAFTVCDGDCDEARLDTYPGALERCDGLDNDCDAMVDEGGEPCTIAGALGPCAMGVLTCEQVPHGDEPLCQPTWTPRTDWCGDGIDGDCDGQADTLDPEGCVVRPVGDTCEDPIEVGAGGRFEHDFANANLDFPEPMCAQQPKAQRDLVYRFTIQEPSFLRFDPTRSVGVSFGLFERDCGGQPRDCSGLCDGQNMCWHGGETLVMPGTWYLVATATDHPEPHLRFTLAWRRMSDLTCSVPDADGDGATLCDGDCDDEDFGVAPGAPELCDGLDNDCDRQIDEGGGACVTGLPGPCGLGWLSCSGTGEVCAPLYQPTPDWCGDGVDSNCSGDELDCLEPPAPLGESCIAPRLLGLGMTVTGDLSTATDDLGGACQPFGSPEHVFAIEVPPLASSVQIDLTGSKDIAVELRVEDCEQGMTWSCAGPYPCPEGLCFARVDVPPFAQSAWLVVEPLGGVVPSEAHYQLRLVAESNGQCLVPDADTDGFTICTNDCDDLDPDVFPGAVERCDGVDEDCDGVVDELGGDCQVPGAHGPCAAGRRACVAGVESCEQVVMPRAELCSTGVDEDCDGEVDEDTAENVCVQLPPGETCLNPIELGQGGLFTADFVGRTAELVNQCSPEPSSADIVYRLVVNEPVRLVFDPSASVGVTFGLYREQCGDWMETCSGPCDGQSSCWHQPSYPLMPGTWYLVASASAWAPNPSVRFTVAILGMSGECSVPDMDGDGFTLCDGDCDDEDFGRAPNAPELCDGIDNDCDRQIDEAGGACLTTGSGPCAWGSLSCVGGAVMCTPIYGPAGVDWCGDTWDDDCSGDWADCTTAVPALGEGCNAPQPLPPGLLVTGDFATATDELPPVMGSSWPDAPERVFTLEPPSVPGARVRVELSGSRGIVGEVRVRGCETGMPYQFFEIVDCTTGCPESLLEIPTQLGGPVHLVLEPREPAPGGGTPSYGLRALVEVDGVCLNPDGDADGFTLCTDDCDDADPEVHPGSAESCNGLDDDCDGAIDEGACGGGDLGAGLIGYWPFDVGGEDLVGGRPLGLEGLASIVPEPEALLGGAVSLQSLDDFAMRYVDDAVFDFGASDFTIQVWVAYDDLSGEQVLVEKFTGDAGPGWTLTRMGGAFQFYWGGALTTAPVPLQTGRYYHVVVRRAGSTLEVFLDGAPIGQAMVMGPVPDTASPLLVGRRNGGDPRGFGTRGRIDELAIWGRALIDSEIGTLNNGGLGHPILP